MNNNISNKDKKDWEKFINSNKKLPNKDLNYKKEINKKIRSIDLHGYSLDQANNLIEKTIIDCHKVGVRELKIITGKGLHSKNETDPYVSKELGILRHSVPNFIRNNENLMVLINQIKEAYKNPLTLSLWNFNIDQIKQIVTGLSNFPRINFDLRHKTYTEFD